MAHSASSTAFSISVMTLFLAENMSSYQHIALSYLTPAIHQLIKLNECINNLIIILKSICCINHLSIATYRIITICASICSSSVCLNADASFTPSPGCLNKTDTYSLIFFSLSSVMRQREIFDLEWLDNHPQLSPDFHLYSTLPWKLHEQPSTLELIRVITTLPTERHTSPDVGFSFTAAAALCVHVVQCIHGSVY